MANKGGTAITLWRFVVWPCWYIYINFPGSAPRPSTFAWRAHASEDSGQSIGPPKSCIHLKLMVLPKFHIMFINFETSHNNCSRICLNPKRCDCSAVFHRCRALKRITGASLASEGRSTLISTSPLAALSNQGNRGSGCWPVFLQSSRRNWTDLCVDWLGYFLRSSWASSK